MNSAMTVTTITETLYDVSGNPDNTPVYFTSALRDSSDDSSVITTHTVSVTPVSGVLTVALEPGPASVTIHGMVYAFTVPTTASRLWPLIAAQQSSQWLDAHLVDNGDGTAGVST